TRRSSDLVLAPVVFRRPFPLVQGGKLLGGQAVQDPFDNAAFIGHQVRDAAPAGAGVAGEGQAVPPHQRGPHELELFHVPRQVLGAHARAVGEIIDSVHGPPAPFAPASVYGTLRRGRCAARSVVPSTRVED